LNGPSDPFDNLKNSLKPSSFLGKFFRSFGIDSNQDYVANIDSFRKELVQNEQQENDGIVGFSDSQSLLTVPVRADSEEIGLVAIESDSIDAFTRDHLHGLKSIGEAAGAVFLEYRHRQACADSIKIYLRNLDTFQSTMNMSRQLEDLKLLYILYEIDYASGKMVARYSKSKFPNVVGDEFRYFFEEASLATQVLQTQKDEFIDDAKDDLASESSKLSPKGVAVFKIEGSVYATPIRFNGSIATILVCWSEEKDHARSKLALACEKKRIVALATLLTNSPEPVELDPTLRRADRFVAELDQMLKVVDGGINWTKKQISSSKFQDDVIEIALRALIGNSCGIRRVRFWLRTQSPACEFKIDRSLCSSAASMQNTEIWNRFLGLVTSDSDPYCKYTVARATEQPFTEFQHMSMFGEVDLNYRALNKCRDGIWLVAPIVYNNEICGFLSADNHIEQLCSGILEIIDERLPEQVREMQRCAMDVIVRLIENIVGLKFNADKMRARVATRKQSQP